MVAEKRSPRHPSCFAVRRLAINLRTCNKRVTVLNKNVRFLNLAANSQKISLRLVPPILPRENLITIRRRLVELLREVSLKRKTPSPNKCKYNLQVHIQQLE